MQHVSAHGADIPAIGLGTWPMTGEECANAVAVALAAGYRHVDTAAAYGNEAEVGEGIRASGLARDLVFVTTKVRPWALADGDMMREVEASLSRLAIDAADLVLIHWPSRTIPVAVAIRSLNMVRRRGLARHIGISNFTTALVEAAWAATGEPLAVLQCEYHPYLGQSKLVAAARARAMAFTAYTPIGHGRELSDPVIVGIAERSGRTPAQVVLRWLVQQPGVIAIPKSATPARIRENIEIFDFALDEADMRAIAGLARGGRLIGSSAVEETALDPAWDDEP